MRDTQQKIIEFIKDVATQTPEKPDHALQSPPKWQRKQNEKFLWS